MIIGGWDGLFVAEEPHVAPIQYGYLTDSDKIFVVRIDQLIGLSMPSEGFDLATTQKPPKVEGEGLPTLSPKERYHFARFRDVAASSRWTKMVSPGR